MSFQGLLVRRRNINKCKLLGYQVQNFHVPFILCTGAASILICQRQNFSWPYTSAVPIIIHIAAAQRSPWCGSGPHYTMDYACISLNETAHNPHLSCRSRVVDVQLSPIIPAHRTAHSPVRKKKKCKQQTTKPQENLKSVLKVQLKYLSISIWWNW